MPTKSDCFVSEGNDVVGRKVKRKGRMFWEGKKRREAMGTQFAVRK